MKDMEKNKKFLNAMIGKTVTFCNDKKNMSCDEEVLSFLSQCTDGFIDILISAEANFSVNEKSFLFSTLHSKNVINKTVEKKIEHYQLKFKKLKKKEKK